MHKFSICFVNKIHPIGGSGTFLQYFKKYLIKKGHTLLNINRKEKKDYIFITGSNIRNIILIFHNILSGSKIITRVDGKNWIHKYKPTSIKRYILSILQNLNVFFFQIISNKIIYQSNFIQKDWGQNIFKKKSVVIYNGSSFNFKRRIFKKTIQPILISVEGSIDSAFQSEKIINYIGMNYRYEIYGKVSNRLKKKFVRYKNITFHGQVPRSKVKKILSKKRKFIFISLEMFAPCPNSVIEALNHGIPVIGYDQGSMREIVRSNQGSLIKVSEDFNFDKSKLLNKVNHISKNYKKYNNNLKNIDNKFKLNYMLKSYEAEIHKT
tara:strand:+ start:105 stop:1073 length:969 start_codon:yes stop_codon:yes gene_type:complete